MYFGTFINIFRSLQTLYWRPTTKPKTEVAIKHPGARVQGHSEDVDDIDLME